MAPVTHTAVNLIWVARGHAKPSATLDRGNNSSDILTLSRAQALEPKGVAYFAPKEPCLLEELGQAVA